MNTVVILCTAPAQATAEHLAVLALEARLAACATLQPRATAWSLWQGRMAESGCFKCDSDQQQARVIC